MVIKYNNSTTRMPAINNNIHIFSFEGGGDLTTMGASWFISYLYYITIDPEHRNWEIPKTKNGRISVFVRTQGYTTTNGIPMHRHYVERVCSMSAGLLATNRIGIRGKKVIAMAQELLSYMDSHQ